MEIFIKASQFILSLSLLIVLHELGHFIPAKLFKTKVEKFYLFFDYKFSLFKKKVGETVYGIGWIPLGGYVKIAGMIDESMDKEHLKEEPKPWEFRSKPAWQRLIIMLGGVFVNKNGHAHLLPGMAVFFFWPSAPQIFGSSHHHVAGDCPNMRRRTELVGVECFVGGKVGHFDAQHILERACHVVAFGHLIRPIHRPLKRRLRVFGVLR